MVLQLRGGSIDIHKGGYYLTMGVASDHPSVSGLNAYGGINMHGNDIGACDNIGINTISAYSGTMVTCNTTFKVPGSTALMIGDRTLSTYVNNVVNAQSSVNQTVWIELGEGMGWKQFVIENGIITAIN